MKSNKKIAIVCNYSLTSERVGGMDRFFWLFDQKCKAEGCDISWYFPNTSQHGEYGNLNLIDPKNKPLEAFFIEHIKNNNIEYDTVVTHFVELCTPFYKKIKSHFPSKIVCIDHNPRPLEGYPFKKKMGKIIKGIFYSRYIDLFVGVSEYTKKHILKDFGFFLSSKTIVIINGLDMKLFVEKKEYYFPPKKFVLTSNLRFVKGIQDLIMAVSLLPEEILKNCDFDIYGEGEYEQKLRKMVLDKKLENTIFFKGSVINLNEIYANYDYLIHPSYAETFCYSVVESLLCRVPVITTKDEGNVLGLVVNGKNGYTFKSTKVDELKDILYLLLSNEIRIEKVTIDDLNFDVSIETMVNNHFMII